MSECAMVSVSTVRRPVTRAAGKVELKVEKYDPGEQPRSQMPQ